MANLLLQVVHERNEKTGHDAVLPLAGYGP